MPQWCWHHSTSGSSSHRAIRCGSWVSGSPASSGGRKLARMPWAATSHVAPLSSVRHAPPHEMPTSTWPAPPRIDADRVDAGVVVAAAEPLRARRQVPEAVDELPRVAAVVGAEQPARDRAAPQHARLVGVARLDRPAELRRPHDLALRHRVDVLDALGLGRVLGRRDLVPRVAAVVAAVEVHAEVPVVERRVDGAVARIAHGVGDR